MTTHSNHLFHLVDYSPWPLTEAIGAMTAVSRMVKWFYQCDTSLFMLGNVILISTVCQWWRDVSREGTYQGLHTIGLRWGMILFIMSEVFFFYFLFLSIFS